MVTSSAVVGSSAISSRGRQASAMAIITRWRMPPESLCGYSSKRCSGAGMRTCRSTSIARACACGARQRRGAAASAFDDLVADREGRVERGHRLLEDHGHAVAAQVAAARACPCPTSSRPSKRTDRRRPAVHQAHDGQRRHALAAARLADQGQRPAGFHREVDAVHRGKAAVVGGELGAQAAHFQQCHQAAPPVLALEPRDALLDHRAVGDAHGSCRPARQAVKGW